MTTAAKTTSKLAKTTSRALVTLKDPTGRKRASARRRLMMTAGAALGGAMLAGVTGFVERRRRQGQAQANAAADEMRARTAGTSAGTGGYHSRHGAGATGLSASTTARPMPTRAGAPIDKLAASAEHLQSWGGDEPGFRAHLGFGIGGSIPADPADPPADRVGDAMPTGGGDALGGTVRGGQPGDYAEQIITGAGEAMSNSTTRMPNGNGTIH